MKSNRALAEYFVQHYDKGEIVPAVIDRFRFDCFEHDHVDPVALDDLIREFENDDTADIERLTAIIAALRDGRLRQEKELVKDIASYVFSHYAEDISIEQVAQHFHISYYYMCHIFKEQHGVSVSTYRHQRRLGIAMERLVASDDKIADIATACGFNSVSYFTEIFTKMVGTTPSAFRAEHMNMPVHGFFSYHDILLAANMPRMRWLADNVQTLTPDVEMISVFEPDEQFNFLHEAAIIEHHGVLYASWYNCPRTELSGYTPICGKRSYDGGHTWTPLEILCEDASAKILYCPPVYGICDDRLYMMVNEMVGPDLMHALDLYVLNEQTDRFELLWTRPIPFKLNTNVVTLPNGKLMLPGRIGELDGFPNTPAVLISDSGKIDAEWRLVKMAPNGDLLDGKQLVYPEQTVMVVDDTLYMFCRNDQRKVPLMYVSTDCGETWSEAMTHDMPIISSKIYAGDLTDGRHYLIANIDQTVRTRLAIYFTDVGGKEFTKRVILFDKNTTDKEGAVNCHYPVACESNGKLYVIATLGYEDSRGAVLFIIDLNEI